MRHLGRAAAQGSHLAWDRAGKSVVREALGSLRTRPSPCTNPSPLEHKSVHLGAQRRHLALHKSVTFSTTASPCRGKGHKGVTLLFASRCRACSFWASNACWFFNFLKSLLAGAVQKIESTGTRGATAARDRDTLGHRACRVFLVQLSARYESKGDFLVHGRHGSATLGHEGDVFVPECGCRGAAGHGARVGSVQRRHFAGGRVRAHCLRRTRTSPCPGAHRPPGHGGTTPSP
jgi:hypothetical protein